MKKSLTIFFAILCSWHLYAQLPVIPVPQTATMDTYGININPQTHSSTPSPFIKRAQSNAYDPNELERRNQRTQQEINAAGHITGYHQISWDLARWQFDKLQSKQDNHPSVEDFSSQRAQFRGWKDGIRGSFKNPWKAIRWQYKSVPGMTKWFLSN